MLVSIISISIRSGNSQNQRDRPRCIGPNTATVRKRCSVAGCCGLSFPIVFNCTLRQVPGDLTCWITRFKHFKEHRRPVLALPTISASLDLLPSKATLNRCGGVSFKPACMRQRQWPLPHDPPPLEKERAAHSCHQ